MSNPDLRRAFAVGEAKRVWKLYGFQTPADLVLEDLAMAMGVDLPLRGLAGLGTTHDERGHSALPFSIIMELARENWAKLLERCTG